MPCGSPLHARGSGKSRRRSPSAFNFSSVCVCVHKRKPSGEESVSSSSATLPTHTRMDTRAQTQHRQECVSAVGVNLHVNEIARGVSGSNVSGPEMPCLTCASAASCVASAWAQALRLGRVLFRCTCGRRCRSHRLTFVVFVCSVLLVLQAGLCVTRAVRGQADP